MLVINRTDIFTRFVDCGPEVFAESLPGRYGLSKIEMNHIWDGPNSFRDRLSQSFEFLDRKGFGLWMTA